MARRQVHQGLGLDTAPVMHTLLHRPTIGSSSLRLWRTCGVLLALQACVSEVGAGPSLGECADPPAGVHTFGQVGIGTCLAGPTDLKTFMRDGRAWLAISNSDLYRSFESGALTLVPLDGLDFSTTRNAMHEVDAVAVELDHFTGHIGLTSGETLALVPTRESEDITTQAANDPVWLVDLSTPEAPELSSPRRYIAARQDPWTLAVADGRAFVVNGSVHSISVFDTDPVRELDLAQTSAVVPIAVDDADASGSTLSLTGDVLTDLEVPRSDAWTLDYVEGTWRVWLPDAQGMTRWTTTGATWTSGDLGRDLTDEILGLDAVPGDAWFGLYDGLLIAYVADAGDIEWVTVDGTGRFAGPSSIALARGATWAETLAGPSIASLEGRSIMAFDGVVEGRTTIGLATTSDGLSYTAADEPVWPVSATQDLSQPSLIEDPFSGRPRLFMTAASEGATRIVTSHRTAPWTASGTWPEPVDVVLNLPPGTLSAAPQVAWGNGQFHMVASTSEDGGETWTLTRFTSPDGTVWRTRDMPFDLASAGTRPPRAGLQFDPVGAWRVTGRDEGPLETLAVAGATFRYTSQAWEITLAHGQAVDDAVLPNSEGGIVPGDALRRDSGTDLLALTATDADGRPRISLATMNDTSVETTLDDVIPEGTGGNARGASSPVLFEDESGILHLLYAAHDTEGLTTIRHATESSDGSFTADDAFTISPDDVGSWGEAGLEPGSVRVTEDGVELWFSAFDGSVWRIGRALGPSITELAPTDAATESWWLNVGEPGWFDDGGVRDPEWVDTDDGPVMLYSGFDGADWTLGAATLAGSSGLNRLLDRDGELPLAIFAGLRQTFAAAGVYAPTATTGSDGRARLWVAGTDGTRPRLGAAIRDNLDVYPDMRAPTPGDQLRFDTVRGDPGRSEIDLSQTIEGFTTAGNGGILDRTDDAPTDVIHDDAGGMLYVASRNLPYLIVVDIRDDSTADYTDANYLDIEAVLRLDTSEDITGIRSLALTPQGLLYAATAEPDGLLVIDTSVVVDDDAKTLIDGSAIASLPVRDRLDDAGNGTFAAISGSDLHYIEDSGLLLMTHFRDNAVSIFDLNLGAFGQEVAYLAEVDENPVAVTSSPDGTLAFVANLTGRVVDGAAESSIAVIDLDPTSTDYLTVLTWMRNR